MVKNKKINKIIQKINQNRKKKIANNKYQKIQNKKNQISFFKKKKISDLILDIKIIGYSILSIKLSCFL